MHMGWILCMWVCKQMGSGTAGKSPAEQLSIGSNCVQQAGKKGGKQIKLNTTNQLRVYVMANGYFKGQQGMSLEQGAHYEIGLNLYICVCMYIYIHIYICIYISPGQERISFQSKHVQVFTLVH